MSDDVFFLRFFWGPRKEGRGEVADRLIDYLAGLRRFDPCFARWYPLAKDPDDPRSTAVPLDKDALSELLRHWIIREQFPPYKWIEELGHRVTLLTGGSWQLALCLN